MKVKVKLFFFAFHWYVISFLVLLLFFFFCAFISCYKFVLKALNLNLMKLKSATVLLLRSHVITTCVIYSRSFFFCSNVSTSCEWKFFWELSYIYDLFLTNNNHNRYKCFETWFSKKEFVLCNVALSHRLG